MMEQALYSLDKNRTSISNWLFFVAVAVFAMIVIGAITRLTESGLSMVEWRPLIGTLPPLNDAEWQRVFELYQQTPEFQKKNFWMDLEDFKRIFFWEWFHRFWGRLIGIFYGLPYIYFLVRGKIPAGYHWPLFGLLILGGLQGLMGWYMVQSGLIDRPSVSHYRLAAHLSLAFLILALLIYTANSIRQTPRGPNSRLYTYCWAALGILTITIFWGAYVAGLDAGLIYNEFPFMGGALIPPEMWQLSPFWVNFFENIPAVQFTHRWLGIASGIALVFVSFMGAKQKAGWPFHALGALVLLQIGLGIATLLSGVWLPLATLHQAVAALLVVTMSLCLYKTRPVESFKAS
ncbi:MAG: COX15/CtaA family protein [Alphaproteobacteria bacterium]